MATPSTTVTPIVAATHPSTAAQARAEAAAAAQRVKELTAQYTSAQAASVAAAQELSAAFEVSATADAARDLLQTQLKTDRVVQANRVRALYVEGTVDLDLAMLGADSIQDALWRAGVGPRVGGVVVRDAETALQRAQTTAALATRQATVAEQAGDKVAVALGRLQDATGSTQLTLTAAQAQLASLSSTARKLQAAEDAAAALARAKAAAAAAQAAQAAAAAAASKATAIGIPSAYLAEYHAAASTCPGMRWSLLAAVGQVESGHGRNNGPSSAGAVGPMQFMPATFAIYAVDGDHDGRTDPWNYADAIWTAARYLCASGVDGTSAADQLALLTYNHAQWYVDLVLRTEAAILASANSANSAN